MDERLTTILATLRERFAADARLEDVEAYLSSEGYERHQIGEIVALWLAEFPGRRASVRPTQMTMNFRVLGPHERSRFAPDAWGYLLALSGRGVLSAPELEHVIDRALTHIDGQIALDDLRVLLEGAGFGDSSGGETSGADHVTIH